MLAPFHAHHWKNEIGYPLGGTSYGTGFCISWQHGPLGRGDARVAANGAFVETIIAAARDRLEYYQTSPFACSENALAISHLTQALEALQQRTAAREARQVEGTHAV